MTRQRINNIARTATSQPPTSFPGARAMHSNQLSNSRLILLLHACTVVIVVTAFFAAATVGVISKFAGTLA